MQFRLLGPLEVTVDGKLIALGGTKQRATLGYLLLRANRVAATSELMQALWDSEEVPTTARKILHNAVWGLRSILAAGSAPAGGSAPELVTRAPGYALQVDPEHVDLSVFQRKVTEGRAALASDGPEAAARLLREGLDLWRGPILADLMESGIAWPELESVRRARLDALEDYFEAELACGRHRAILGDLTTMVESEPLRERACGQLMTALYRCGLQADALNVYDRVRSSLVENLGLEPGRGLQMLQHSILTHDPALSAHTEQRPPRQRPTITVPHQSTPLNRPGAGPSSPHVRVAEPVSEPEPVTPPVAPPATATATAMRHSGTTVTERIQVSAVLVGMSHEALPEAYPGEIDTTLGSAGDAIGQVIERFGGTVVATIGSVSLALFGVRGLHHDDAERAVRAALDLRDRFASRRGPSLRAAVTTGQALVRTRSDANGTVSPLSAVGALLDDGRTLLAQVPDGEVWMSGATRLAAGPAVACRPAGDVPDIWQALATLATDPGIPADRTYELGVLNGLLDWGKHRSVPHLVTVLGAPGVGKTHLLTEFRRGLAKQQRPSPRVLAAREPIEDGALSLAAQTLAAYCSLRPRDSAREARDKLAAALWQLPVTASRRARLHGMLLPLLPGRTQTHGGRPGEILDTWVEFLAAAARLEPVVVLFDDVHRADDAFLDRLERLTDGAGNAPLLAIATARPELLDRRPGWGGGKRQVSTLTLLSALPGATPAAEVLRDLPGTPVAV
ncbi:BTAD domain-containing putative transcriptional regulator [Streptomyces sp. ISL-94]|uniref:BTAD domain-containing putative transcriptional regulator n=1 Tax=Streptomyces sp. ISL-94 TaxID=2819190 RepID=UPI001BE924F7|nr:BTAD domain-containing putative transcriptional regulator [Streptomyces sp. ISL-94]MBT2479350.1 AAA family ATPase [Streptomyces sp. ISL-94]